MLTSPRARWTVPGATFAVWALAAASALYWGLKLSGSAPALAVAPLPARAPAAADAAAVARLLGSSPAPQVAVAEAPPLSSRFALAGVVAGRSRSGVALISVDGRPAKPFRVGATVDGDLVLKSVEGRRAVLGPANGAAAVTLELPPRTAGGSAPAPLPPGPMGMPPGPAGIPLPASPPGLSPGPTGASPAIGNMPIPPGVQLPPGMQPAVPGAQPRVLGVQPVPAPTAAPR